MLRKRKPPRAREKKGGRKRKSPVPGAGAPEPKAKSGADEMRLLHEEWRIIALFFSSDRFLEAGSRGLRDLLLYSRELAFVAPLAQWNRNCNDLLAVIRLVDTRS